MFTASLNGVEIDFSTKECVSQPSWSIKSQEPQIIGGQLDLVQVVNNLQFDFVSTHLYAPLKTSRYSVVNILISDPQTTELIILRQMKLQKLSIEIRPHETTYRLIKAAVDRQNWNLAARLWFAMAQRIWQHDRWNRINNPLPNAAILVFDRLFHSDFVDSIRRQISSLPNLELIAYNHRCWRQRNLNHDFDSTICHMARKLRRMDWSQTQGRIIYDQS